MSLKVKEWHIGIGIDTILMITRQISIAKPAWCCSNYKIWYLPFQMDLLPSCKAVVWIALVCWVSITWHSWNFSQLRVVSSHCSCFSPHMKSFILQALQPAWLSSAFRKLGQVWPCLPLRSDSFLQVCRSLSTLVWCYCSRTSVW